MITVTYYSLHFPAGPEDGADLLRRLSRIEGGNVRVTEADAAACGVPAGLHRVADVRGWSTPGDDCAGDRLVEVLLVPPTPAQARWDRCVDFAVIRRLEAHVYRRTGREGPLAWDEVDDDREADADDPFDADPSDARPAA